MIFLDTSQCHVLNFVFTFFSFLSPFYLETSEYILLVWRIDNDNHFLCWACKFGLVPKNSIWCSPMVSCFYFTPLIFGSCLFHLPSPLIKEWCNVSSSYKRGRRGKFTPIMCPKYQLPSPSQPWEEATTFQIMARCIEYLNKFAKWYVRLQRNFIRPPYSSENIRLIWEQGIVSLRLVILLELIKTNTCKQLMCIVASRISWEESSQIMLLKKK